MQIAQHINRNNCLVKTYAMGLQGTADHWLVIAVDAQGARDKLAEHLGIKSTSSYIKFYRKAQSGMAQAII